jgi:amidase
MTFADYAKHDALSLAELVRKKEVTPLELVDAAIERADKVPQLNAFVCRMSERARADAQKPLDGPFAGVPFVIKDLVQPVEGAPFTRGSHFFRDDVPQQDSELIRRHRRAGLLFIAKTNTPEFGLTPFTEPVRHGATKNPWNLEYGTGGSSGGSGAAVAAGVVPMGHGGDGGGSIRIPASCCGMFGLKPTRGRTPGPPDAAEGWAGFALDHAITRTVRDSAALLDATKGYAPGDPYDAPPSGSFLDETRRDPQKLRIAFCRAPHLPAKPHADVIAAAEDAAKLCASLGHDVEEATPPIDVEQTATDFATVVSVAVAADVAASEAAFGRKSSPGDWELNTRVVALLGRTIGGLQLEEAKRRLQMLGRTMAKFFGRFDVMLTPTLGTPPPRIGSLQVKGIERRVQEVIADRGLTPVLKIPGLIQKIAAKTYGFIPYTPLANFTGLPSMSVPLYWNREGLPIGSMFTARFGDEATLFRLAAQLEKARPWADRRPPVFAG